MSYFPAFSCVALMKIYSKPYSVLICNNYKCYKLYRIYLYNFTQVRSSYAWKSHKYYIHHSNIIILGTRESEKKIRGELRLEFFRGKIPSSEASSFPDRRTDTHTNLVAWSLLELLIAAKNPDIGMGMIRV